MTLPSPPQTKERLAALEEMRAHMFATAQDNHLTPEDQVQVAAALLASCLLSSRKQRLSRDALDELVRRGEELALAHAEAAPGLPAAAPGAPAPVKIPPVAVPTAVMDALPGDQLFDEMFNELVTPDPLEAVPATQVLPQSDLNTNPFAVLPSTADVEVGSVLRRFPRFEARDRVVVDIADKNELSEMYTNNISMGGLYIETQDPPPVGTRLTVQLSTPDGALDLTGEVVHAASDPMGDMPPGIGFQFDKLSVAQKTALDSYILGITNRLALIEVDTDDGVAKRAMTLLRAVEAGRLYEAVGLDPRADTAAVNSKLADVEARFKKAAVKAEGSDGLRINNALRVLMRLKEILGRPTRRLSYDFQHGLERVEERLEEAKRGGPTPQDMRGVWAKVFPDRVNEANRLVGQALAAEKAGNYDDAARHGQAALDKDPFYVSLRKRVAVWAHMDDIVAMMKRDDVPASSWPDICEERGLSMDKLRDIWEELYPQRVEEAKAYGRKALQAETIKRMDLALVAAHAALDRDPFNERLRAALTEWTRDPVG